MARVNAQVYSKILANCERKGDCLMWKGPYDNFGNPTFPAKRHTGAHIRQDILVFEEAYEISVKDNEYLIHKCDNRGCLNPSHMEYLTDTKDRASWDRMIRSMAKRMLSDGKTTDEVSLETGLSIVRLMVIQAEIPRLSVVTGSRQ